MFLLNLRKLSLSVTRWIRQKVAEFVEKVAKVIENSQNYNKTSPIL